MLAGLGQHMPTSDTMTMMSLRKRRLAATLTTINRSFNNVKQLSYCKLPRPFVLFGSIVQFSLLRKINRFKNFES
jgi:hypothetical protein